MGVVTSRDIRQTLQQHFALWAAGHDDPGLKEPWLALFTKSCTVEEPVGSEPRQGMQSQGWDMGHSDERRVFLDPELVVVPPNANEAATWVRLRLVTARDSTELDALGTWTFSADGRIAGSRIFIASNQMGPAAWPASGD